MSSTHTSNALSSSFANFLDNLHASLLAGDFTISKYDFTQDDYLSYTFSLGNFRLYFALNFRTSSIVHFSHSSTVDLSPFEDVFNFDLFSSILDNSKNLSL